MTDFSFIQDGNIFDTDCEAIVNPVNCVGVMGAGLAKKFALRYPKVCEDFNKYSRNIITHVENSGKPLPLHGPKIYNTWENVLDKNVIMFPTKIHWRNDSKLEYVELNLIRLGKMLRFERFKSIAIPGLGCGLGGLKWEDVKPLILQHLSESEMEKIEIYEPEPVAKKKVA